MTSRYSVAPEERQGIQVYSLAEAGVAVAEVGYRVVRFPYWIQLTSETHGHYFGLSAGTRQDFPHEFITTKIFPASFCGLGV